MFRLNTRIRRALALLAAAGLVLLTQGLTRTATAQTIDPWYLLPEADGANIVEISASYQHFNAFQFSNGQTVPNASLDQYSATIRYAHFIYLAGLPAGFQLFQPVNYFANFHFDGVNTNAPGLGQIGAGNTVLSAFLWPYADRESQTYLYTAAYVAPPDGSYTAGNTFNAAYGGWQGDVQAGAFKGFNENISVEAAFDADFHGASDLGFGTQRNIAPIYRVQLWANWDWTNWGWANGLRTSLGYTGVFGGAWTDTFDGVQTSVPRNAEAQTLRAAVSYWWNPRILTLLELAHDVQTGGGYQLGIGATAHVRILF